MIQPATRISIQGMWDRFLRARQTLDALSIDLYDPQGAYAQARNALRGEIRAHGLALDLRGLGVTQRIPHGYSYELPLAVPLVLAPPEETKIIKWPEAIGNNILLFDLPMKYWRLPESLSVEPVMGMTEVLAARAATIFPDQQLRLYYPGPSQDVSALLIAIGLMEAGKVKSARLWHVDAQYQDEFAALLAQAEQSGLIIITSATKNNNIRSWALTYRELPIEIVYEEKELAKGEEPLPLPEDFAPNVVFPNNFYEFDEEHKAFHYVLPGHGKVAVLNRALYPYVDASFLGGEHHNTLVPYKYSAFSFPPQALVGEAAVLIRDFDLFSPMSVAENAVLFRLAEISGQMRVSGTVNIYAAPRIEEGEAVVQQRVRDEHLRSVLLDRLRIMKTAHQVPGGEGGLAWELDDLRRSFQLKLSPFMIPPEIKTHGYFSRTEKELFLLRLAPELLSVGRHKRVTLQSALEEQTVFQVTFRRQNMNLMRVYVHGLLDDAEFELRLFDSI